MKSIIISLIVCLLSFTSKVIAQYDQRQYAPTSQNPNVPYRLFPTDNMWNLLKLDTRTGRVWMVQYVINGKESDRREFVVNSIKLEEQSDENIGRFTLYPTSNKWTFILLDQYKGATYQVQWSTDGNEGLWIINGIGNETSTY